MEAAWQDRFKNYVSFLRHH